MKIAFFTGTVDLSRLSGAGGVSYVLSRISSGLASHGIDVEIICAYKGDSDSPFFEKNINIKYLQKNIKHEYINVIFYKFIFWIKILSLTVHFLRSSHPNYLISTSPPMSIILFLASLGTNNKIIAWENIAFNHYRGILYYIRMFIFKRIHSVITVSTEDHILFLNNNINSVYIRNPIEKPLNISKNVNYDLKFLSAGRLTYQKGFDLLIEIIKLYEIKFKDTINLTILGSGPDGPMLNNLVKKLSLKSNIIFEDFNPQLFKFYNESDVFLLPSRFEGLPIVLLESQSYGIPTIAFNCPTGPKDVITNNVNGFLIECFNLENFANTIYKIKNDRELIKKLSDGAFGRAKLFYIDNIIDEWNKNINSDFRNTI